MDINKVKIEKQPVVCPWCRQSEPLSIMAYGGNQYAVICDTCGARGPLAASYEKAANEWNRWCDLPLPADGQQ